MRGNRQLIRALAGLGLLVAGLGACDVLGPGGPEGPGAFSATLISPNGAEGSGVFELVGGIGLGTVLPVDGEVLYHHADGSTRIVVVLDEPGEIRFKVRTEDIGELPDVRVLEVADGADQLRPSLSGYSVRFRREKDPSGNGRGGQP